MKWNDLQLKFDLEVEGENAFDDEELSSGALSAEQRREISEAYRETFEDCKHAPCDAESWYGDYLTLRENGWPWRVAAYISWASSPKELRWPATLQELAKLLGLTSPRSIYNWRRKYASIDAIIAMMQAKPLLEHRRDVLEALVAVAKTPDYKGHNDRKLFLELTGDYVRKSELKAELNRVKDLSELSDEELDQLIGEDWESNSTSYAYYNGEEKDEE